MIWKKSSLLLEELVTCRLGFFDCIHPYFWCSGLVVITTPLLHSAKIKLWFCAGSEPTHMCWH